MHNVHIATHFSKEPVWNENSSGILLEILSETLSGIISQIPSKIRTETSSELKWISLGILANNLFWSYSIEFLKNSSKNPFENLAEIFSWESMRNRLKFPPRIFFKIFFRGCTKHWKNSLKKTLKEFLNKSLDNRTFCSYT